MERRQISSRVMKEFLQVLRDRWEIYASFVKQEDSTSGLLRVTLFLHAPFLSPGSRRGGMECGLQIQVVLSQGGAGLNWGNFGT